MLGDNKQVSAIFSTCDYALKLGRGADYVGWVATELLDFESGGNR